MKKVLAQLIPPLYGKYLSLLALISKKKAAQTAFDIFCTIRKGRVTPVQKDFLDAAKLTVEHINGQHIQVYHWKGSKPTVLLMHGWESNTFRWRNLIKKLRENDFDILAFDAPGHGHSTGKKLHVPLYAMTSRFMLDKYKPLLVVAHSVGGMTILYDHYKTPNSSVEKIVTIGSPCEFSEIMGYFQELLGFSKRVHVAMDGLMKEKFDLHINEFSSTRFVANNTKKGLLFHDEGDIQVRAEASKSVHQHWQGSQLVLTNGLGHSMHQDAVNDQIIDFLSS